MPIYVKPTGPRDARIAIVGEAPGRDEEQQGRPFCGASGYELTTELRDAGIAFHECFVTNVIRFRPENNDIEHFITPVKKRGEEHGFVHLDGMWVAPFVKEHLQTLMFELEEVKPNVIVALGNTPLWALAGKSGITKWRGSQMLTKWGQKLVPMVHPALVLREYSWRATSVLDFKQRVKPESYSPSFDPPKYDFTIKPSFGQVAAYLAVLEAEINNAREPFKLTLDLETRRGQIACLGLGTSARKAFCVPFLCVSKEGGHYWSLDEEVWIVEKLRKLLTMRNLFLIGQNLLYDAQYIVKQFKFVPFICQDTMLWHQTCFPGTPKALDYLASWYAEFYCYWKDEGKEWTSRMNEEELWHYNCLDCVYTYEVAERLTEVVNSLGLQKQCHRQQSLFYPVLDMMLTGIAVDKPKREVFHKQLEDAIAKKESDIKYALGHPLNPRSAPQMNRLFYTDFQQTPIISRKTGAPTLDDKALSKIALKEPLLGPLISDIQDLRSFGVFKSTFIEAKLDDDQRMRSSFNIAGAETFRFSSSTNAFNNGMNLQNVPKTGSDPDVRCMFVPDPEHFIMDWDLNRADVQAVAWEANDAELKQMLRENVDLHTENAKTLLCSRQVAKMWVHGSNYGGSARTMAANCGISVAQSETMRRRWFAAHPGILEWHRRIERQLKMSKSVYNAFGYRRLYFDRVEGLLPEALAWIGQSNTAIVINMGLLNVFRNLPEVQLLLQVHDSLVMQTHRRNVPGIFPKIKQQLEVVVPYDDPLVIPVSGKGSYVSWGDCKELEAA